MASQGRDWTGKGRVMDWEDGLPVCLLVLTNKMGESEAVWLMGGRGGRGQRAR